MENQKTDSQNKNKTYVNNNAIVIVSTLSFLFYLFNIVNTGFTKFSFLTLPNENLQIFKAIYLIPIAEIILFYIGKSKKNQAAKKSFFAVQIVLPTIAIIMLFIFAKTMINLFVACTLMWYADIFTNIIMILFVVKSFLGERKNG